MAFQLSPGVLVSEKDLTNVVPAVSSTAGGFVGNFVWGPVNQIKTVASENQLVRDFGKPNAANVADFFTAANFLGYGNNLQLVRAVGASAKNAVSAGGAVLIKNEDDYLANFSDGSQASDFAAKCPGNFGNSLRVSMADSATFESWEYKGNFDSAPSTSAASLASNVLNDELHIIVLDEFGAFTGTPGSVLEKFAFVSKQPGNKKADGSNNYYKDVINSQSKYVWWMSHPVSGTSSTTTQTNNGTGTIVAETGSAAVTGTGTAFTTQIQTGDVLKVGGVTVGTVASIQSNTALTLAANAAIEVASTANFTFSREVTTTSPSNWGTFFVNGAYTNLSGALDVVLSGGVDDLASSGDLIDAYDLFANKELVDVSLLLTGAHDVTVAKHAIDNIAVARLDCMVFVSPPMAAVYNNVGGELNAVTDYRNNDLGVNTSYAVMDSGWKVQYNRYSDTYVNVPLNADTAGLCARTDQTNDPWWSPAGYNRGQIKNVVKLLWSPNQTERDGLYKNGINPVITQPGQGTLLYGDKTLLAKPSAFDRINVRRLFIVLEKAVATAAKYQLFEFNDVFTRSQFRSMVEPFLRDVRGRRGIYDFRVVCDESNNTGEVIDRNEFVADIYIKPAKSINFIYLNFVATRTSVSFEEVGA